MIRIVRRAVAFDVSAVRTRVYRGGVVVSSRAYVSNPDPLEAGSLRSIAVEAVPSQAQRSRADAARWITSGPQMTRTTHARMQARERRLSRVSPIDGAAHIAYFHTVKSVVNSNRGRRDRAAIAVVSQSEAAHI